MVLRRPCIADVPALRPSVAKKALDKGENSLAGQITRLQVTVVSVSGRFLKTKYYQNHEQDTWPEEFSKRKDRLPASAQPVLPEQGSELAHGRPHAPSCSVGKPSAPALYLRAGQGLRISQSQQKRVMQGGLPAGDCMEGPSR